MAVIKAKLTDEQKVLFGKTCMGHFLDVKNITLSGQIFHNMIMRQVYYEDSSSDDEVINIDVCGIVVPFTKVHLAVISGLKIHGDTNAHVVKLGDNIRDKYFSLHKMVKREKLDVVYSNIKAESDEDAVKLALLYFLVQVLLSNAKSTNVPICASELPGLDMCRAPWGDVVNNYLTFVKNFLAEDLDYTLRTYWQQVKCIITKIEPIEEQLSEMRTRGLIAVEKASLKRKLVLQKESEAPQDEDDEVIKVRNIHPSKCQKVKLGATVTERGFCEAVLKYFKNVKGEMYQVKEELQGIRAQQFDLLQMMCNLMDMVQGIESYMNNVNVFELRPRPINIPWLDYSYEAGLDHTNEVEKEVEVEEENIQLEAVDEEREAE
ncbi:hypothetical protein TorRG33x02_197410 [Trema orientale]|uniref:DUF1985 domain-containing protein n=1 Tax=Trema orientale TaxID=63057 RepID=A0A2P5EFU9_TREOI|nr:hypothetical protein TorRG33x02_197410 [Trema orientale]